MGRAGRARCPSNNVCLLPSPITTRHLDHRSPLRCTFQNPIFNICFLPATRLILLHGQIYALGPGVISGKSIYAPVGRALLRSASLECDFGAWDVEAKLACPRSKHTTYLSSYPQHTLVHILSRPPPSSPLPLTNNCSWTVTLSTQLPRTERSKGSSLSPVTSPSLPHPRERGRAASIREHRPWFCLSDCTCTLRLLMLPCCQPAHALFQASSSSADTSKQCIKTSPTYAITHFRYTRAPGYLSSLDQHI